MDAREWQERAAREYRAGNVKAAVQALRHAVDLDPGAPEPKRYLAELAAEAGDIESAVMWLTRAAEDLARAPTPEGLNLLAASWLDLGRREAALELAIQALNLQPNPASRHLAGAAIGGMTDVPHRYRGVVARAHAEGWIGDGTMRPAAALLRSGDWGAAADLARDPLLSAVLRTSAVRDPQIERRLTALRRALLLEPLGEVLWPLAAGVAFQCFLNEYAWTVTPEEQATVLALMAKPKTPEVLLKLGAYVGLELFVGEIEGRAWPEPVLEIIRQQVYEPRRERELEATIPRITAIRPGVSQLVREMYEANPYPRWRRALPPRPQPLAKALQSQFPRFRFDPIPNAAAPEILIAGCGTGKQAIETAGRYDGARVLAVDLSLASLAFAKRQTLEAEAGNIEYGQADILELAGAFDVIEASGVVHHMADPPGAVRKLVSMLRPGGLIRLGFYSEAGRRYLAPAQALARQYGRDPEGVRALRQTIFGAPEGSPLRDVMTAGDFYSTSNCRDLLMHVVEHQFTIGDIKRMVADNGLRFVGFSASPEIMAAYRARFTEDSSANDLDNWAAFEADNPATFRAMYQFWMQKPVAGI